jgi:hypothetical protein
MTRARYRWLRLLAGYAVLGALAWLIALPLWFAAAPAWRPAVVRLAAAAVLAVALARVLGAARRRVTAQAPSAFDRATVSARDEPSVPGEFRELIEEIRFGRATEGYWSRVLQPRLASLAARLPAGPPLPEPPPARWRRLLKLGPSLAAIRDLIKRLEERA